MGRDACATRSTQGGSRSPTKACRCQATAHLRCLATCARTCLPTYPPRTHCALALARCFWKRSRRVRAMLLSWPAHTAYSHTPRRSLRMTHHAPSKAAYCIHIASGQHTCIVLGEQTAGAACRACFFSTGCTCARCAVDTSTRQSCRCFRPQWRRAPLRRMDAKAEFIGQSPMLNAPPGRPSALTTCLPLPGKFVCNIFILGEGQRNSHHNRARHEHLQC